MIDIDNIISLINIQPSLEWLTSCRRYLEQRHIPLTDDAIFQQLLHADLRHVIGSSHEDEEEEEEEEEKGELRRGIASSLPTSSDNNAPCKTILKNYRGMVQIEEVVDVSLDNESRIGGNTTTPQTQTQGQGQQRQQQQQPPPQQQQHRRQRCLKFHLTDGFSPHHPLLAMETHPLPSLPSSPPSGLKLLLHGTIIIRYGVLLLHEGNTTVLGGFVPSKVKFQQKEMERVRGRSGVGVDPTVRALIWNPERVLEGEGEDEGEGESTDVVGVATVGRQQLPVGQQQQQQSVYNNQSGGGYVMNNIRPTVTTNANSNGSNVRNNNNVNNRYTNPVRNNNDNNNRHNHHHDDNDSAAMDWSPTTTTTANITPAVARQSQPISRIHNPYNTTATTTTTTTNNPYNTNTTTTTTTNSSLSSSSSFHRPTNTTTSTVDLTTPPSSPPTTTTTTSLLSPTALTSPLSFSEFHHLWTNTLSRDRSAYEGHYNRQTTFIVPAKMRGGRIVSFNIEKDKTGSSSKKYSYYLTCHITGTDPVYTICCQVSDEILEPYFGKSAVEMRKISREHKSTSDKLVHDGGERVKNEFTQLSTFRMRLLWMPRDYFDFNIVDKRGGVGKCPVFLVVGQGDS